MLTLTRKRTTFCKSSLADGTEWTYSIVDIRHGIEKSRPGKPTRKDDTELLVPFDEAVDVIFAAGDNSAVDILLQIKVIGRSLMALATVSSVRYVFQAIAFVID
jgi:hypothetical protein